MKRFLRLWLVIAFVKVTQAAERNSSKELFEKYQKHLEVLKNLAEDGGHPDPESITKFDEDVCYTYDCIEAGEDKIPFNLIFYLFKK